jgi:tellurite resistance protein
LSLPLLSVIQAWAAIVWADGMIASAEGRTLRRLIQAAPLSPADRATALEFLDATVDLPPSELLAPLDEPARRGVYQAALRLAAADGKFVLEEGSLLEALRRKLELGPAEAAELEAEILEHALIRQP